MSEREGTIIRPSFHHVNLKTTRLEEMIEWYGRVVGAEVIHQGPEGAWLTTDEANHRIALLYSAELKDDPEKLIHTGMHHSAFEYASIDGLLDTYVRLKATVLKVKESGHEDTSK